MPVEVKDPKTLLMGALILAGAGGLGHTIGLTVEPTSVTDLRVENARLQARLEILESVVDECSTVLTIARARATTETP